MSVRRLLTLLSVVVVLLLCSIALAQGATPIEIGQNTVGELGSEVSAIDYTLTVAAGETASIQVLALSLGFVPHIRVVNAQGVAILDVANPNGLNTLVGSALFDEAGTYALEISGENGTFGQFALSLQAGAPPPEPTVLSLNKLVHATVGSGAPVQVYRFSAAPDSTTMLTIHSEAEGTSPLISLFDEAADKTIASIDAGVRGIAFELPEGSGSYRVEVRSSGAGDTPFTICPGDCDDSGAASEPSSTPTPASATATPVTSALDCTAASNANNAVNVRSGNGTQYTILGSLPAGQSYPVLGQIADGSWFEVNMNGRIGWVSAGVVRLVGDCAALPVIPAPTNGQIAPTSVPSNNGGGGQNPPNNGGGQNPPNNGGGGGNLPDLTVYISQADNLHVSANAGAISLFLTTGNSGTTPIGPYTIRACVDGGACADVSRPGMGANLGDIAGLTVPVTDGAQTITVTIDPDNAIPESNEGNNSASAPIVFDALPPDLTVEITGQSLANDVETISFTVTNVGQGASNTRTEVKMSTAPTGLADGYANIPPLQVGESYSGSMGFPHVINPNLPVPVTVILIVDDNGIIAESNEDNNVAVTVVP